MPIGRLLAKRQMNTSKLDSGEAEHVPHATHPIQVFSGYTDDDAALIRRYAQSGLTAQRDYLVDFIGVRTHHSALWSAIGHLKGTIGSLPFPADHHAEAIEWVGLLKAVESCTDRFVAMELGAGWGPWITAGAVVAQRIGVPEIRLTGVEADPGRFEMMNRHLTDNGFDPREHRLIQGAVGAKRGLARWPSISNAAEAGGARPVREANLGDAAYSGDLADGMDVEVHSFRELLLLEPQWDFVHIDIQGWEAEVLASCGATLSERVRWLVVGTHSRALDGAVLGQMWQQGWVLENEKPTKFEFRQNSASLEAMTQIDGTQVWRNPAVNHLS